MPAIFLSEVASAISHDQDDDELVQRTLNLQLGTELVTLDQHQLARATAVIPTHQP